MLLDMELWPDADHQTGGMIGDATQWLQRGGKRVSDGVKKFKDDTAFSLKVSKLKYYNQIDRAQRPGDSLSRKESEDMERLRWWMYNLKIAELAKADQNGTLTPEDRLTKQTAINNMKENWLLLSQDDMDDIDRRRKLETQQEKKAQQEKRAQQEKKRLAAPTLASKALEKELCKLTMLDTDVGYR
jgi:hypothetical protein